MSNIKANSAIQTIKLAANTKQTEKIVIKPGQAIQLMVDGQLYTGQQHINGKAVRLVRKGRTLEVQLEGQEHAAVVVEDFYAAAEVAEHAAAQDLSETDVHALLETGSVQQWTSADTASAAGLPAWGTLMAQAPAAASGTAAASTATASTATAAAAAAQGHGLGAFLMGALGIAALASSSDSSSGTPAAGAQTIVNGLVTAGPVIPGHKLSITIYDINGKVLVSGVTVKDDGTFTANLGNHGGPIVAVLVDGDNGNDYRDEKTGGAVDLSTVLMTAATVTAGATVKLNINPATTVAALMAGITTTDAGVPALSAELNAENFATETEDAATAVAKALNLDTAQNLLTGDVVTTVTAGGVSNMANANNYGKALAVLSAMDTTNNATGVAAVLNDLKSGIYADGTLTEDLADKLTAALTIAKVLMVDVGPTSDAASLAENANNLVVYAPDTAATLDGTTFAYALSGADAALFTVNQTNGAVSFLAAPNHEAPADVGADNVYNVTLTVTATHTGGTPAVTQTSTDSVALAITVTDVADVKPVFTSGTTATVAENTATTAVVYTAAATPDVSGAAVSYSLTGADAARFVIANDGKVTFQASPNYEAPADAGGDNVYNISVIATTGSVSETQNVVITVTNENEAPTVANAIDDQTFTVGGTVDSFTFNANVFADVDANTTLTYTASLVGGGALPGWLTFDPVGRTFSGNPTGAGTTNVRVTATDGGNLSVSDDFVITAVAAPELKATQSLDNVSNLDVRSKLVLDFTQDLTLGSGQIRIKDNEGTSGWLLSNQGETRQDTTDNDVVITLTNGVVTNLTVGTVGWAALGGVGISPSRLENSVRVSGSKLIIDIGGTDATTFAASNTDWTFDWDFATDYHVEFDAGIVSAAGQVNVAMNDATRVNFTTVTPVGNNTGAASQTMGDDATVTTGTTWHSAHVGSSTGTATSMAFGTGSHALYMVGYGNPDGTGKLATSMTGHVAITGFGADDLLYIDNMGAMAALTSNGLTGASWTGAASTGTTKRDMGNGDNGDPLWVTFPDYAGPTIRSNSTGGGFDRTFETHFQTNAVIFG